MQIHDLISRAVVYKAGQLLHTAMKIAALKPLITLGSSSTHLPAKDLLIHP